jgi:hypothetical protein
MNRRLVQFWFSPGLTSDALYGDQEIEQAPGRETK